MEDCVANGIAITLVLPVAAVVSMPCIVGTCGAITVGAGIVGAGIVGVGIVGAGIGVAGCGAAIGLDQPNHGGRLELVCPIVFATCSCIAVADTVVCGGGLGVPIMV